MSSISDGTVEIDDKICILLPMTKLKMIFFSFFFGSEKTSIYFNFIFAMMLKSFFSYFPVMGFFTIL